ncbi:MAG: tetratricopeptide repeat protein [Thermodesulfobacteriota bacterium]
MMKNNFLVLIIFALFSSACTAAGGGQPAAKLAEGLDPSADYVESECSYFYFMWGRTAELEGKLEEAREAYEKALVCDLHAVQIMHRLAVLLINMDKKDVAAGWIKTIIDENPEDLASYGFLANLYVSMDEFAKAEEIYLGVIDKNPQDYDNMLLLGALYARQKKFDEARDTLEKLIKLNPESFIGHHYLAKIYLETEKFAKARSSFEKALELNWSPFLAFEAAFFLAKKGFPDDALRLYRQIIVEDEDNERVRTMAISLLLKLDRIDEAIVAMEELLPQAADPLKVELNLSRLLLDRKKYDEAISHLLNILDTDPEFNDVRILLAVAYHDKGDATAAKSSLEKIGPQSADYENATVFLTRILVEEKKHGAAINLLRGRISDEKTRRRSFYPGLASVLQKQQKNDEAASVFQEALTLYPEDKDLLLEHALFQDEQGDVDGALRTMAKVLLISPDEPYALNYMGYTWAERGVELEKALAYVEKALELRPDDGFVRDSLGWVLFKMGRLDEALAELQKALKIEGDDPAINDHIGDVYHRLGRMKKARKAWGRALVLQKDEKKKSRLRKKIEAAGK